MLAIRVYSETNPWVDCVVFVHDDILEGQAFEAIQKGMNEWNEEDSDLCWGDAITTALSEAGVPHSIVYGDLNEDETDTTPAWDEFVRILAKDGDIPVSKIIRREYHVKRSTKRKNLSYWRIRNILRQIYYF